MDLELGGVSVALAFVAGLLSVASPCVLPLVPAYLGYLTGASLEAPVAERPVVVSQSASGGASLAVAQPVASALPSPFLHSVSFVGGFTAVFVAMGASVGLLGYFLGDGDQEYFLRDNRDLILKIAGGMLIVMGLHLANVITIPFLNQERRIDAGAGAKVGYARSFFVGSAFSAGWSPCIGPTLGAVLTLAVSSSTVLEASLLLLVYAAGLSLPFLAMGLAYNGVKPVYNRLKRYVGVVNYLSGALLIVVGILVFTDSLINMNNFFDFGFLRDISSDA